MQKQISRATMSDNHKRKAARNGEDIISNLPRFLIDSILERMPIRDAARTCILSRKWRYMWATHPQLLLDKQFFKESFKNKPFVQYEFLSIITTILLLHQGPIPKFTLYIPNVDFEWEPDIDRCLLFLTRNGLKELTLINSNQNPYKLPSCVFSCPGLTHLKLLNCIFKPPRAFGGFLNLISLYFKKTAFPSNIFGTLVLGAPLLESLTFEFCTGIDNFNVYAPKLRLLSLSSCHEVKLICFKISPSLTDVHVALCRKVEHSKHGESFNLVEFLGNLPKIVRLRCDGFFLKFLAAGTIPEGLPTTAHHLKYLVLYNLGFNNLDQISCALCLLRSSPNLQKLEIQVSGSSDNAMEPVLNYLEAPDCMDQTLDHLQTVQIGSMKGLKTELFFIQLILAHSPLLEMMFVEYSGEIDTNEGFRISRELMRFSRASPKAKIIYLDSNTG